MKRSVLRPRGKTLVRVLVTNVAVLLLALSVEVRAQSAVDGFDPGADDGVFALAAQADGKLLVGGLFTTLGGGGTGTISRNRIGRLNFGGAPDPSFDPGANGLVDALADPDAGCFSKDAWHD